MHNIKLGKFLTVAIIFLAKTVCVYMCVCVCVCEILPAQVVLNYLMVESKPIFLISLDEFGIGGYVFYMPQ